MKNVVPILILPALFLLGLAGLFVVGQQRIDDLGQGWKDEAARMRASNEETLRTEFDRFQDRLHRCARDAAAGVVAALRTPSGPAGDPSPFDALGRAVLPGLTCEYYDSAGNLIAWSGPAGPVVTAPEMEAAPRSYVRRGPIHSHLVIVLPLVASGRNAGHIVAKALFSSSHPVGGGLALGEEGAEPFSDLVGRIVGPGIEFLVPDGSAGPGPSIGDGAEAGIPGEAGAGAPAIVALKGITGNDAAYAVVPPPDRPARLGEARDLQEGLLGLCLTGFLLSLTGGAAWRYRRFPRRALFVIALNAALWTVRYLMVLLDVPGRFNPLGLFDPSLFASSFGYGAAKSPGEMLISALLLAYTMSAFFRLTLDGVSSRTAGAGRGRPGAAGTILAGTTGAFIILAAIGPLTRAFWAVTRSVVFDSRIELNDPRSLYPGLEGAVLLLGGVLLVFALVLGAMVFFAAARGVAGRFVLPGSAMGTWALTFVLAIAGSVMFDLVHPNPLGGPIQRILMTAGVGALTMYAFRRRSARGPGAWPGTILAVSVVAVGALVPSLDARTHEHDRTLIEAVVRDLARPVDAWMTVLLDRSLTMLSDSAAAATLASAEPERIRKLAFNAWSASVLAAEGNTCSVTFVDLEGSVVSHFRFGPAQHWAREVPMDEMPRSTRLTGRETRTLDGRPTPWYRGYAPVFAADQRFVGGVWVGIAPVDPARVLGQENDLLHPARRLDRRTPERKIIVATYASGRLESSSSDDLPLRRPLPPQAAWDSLSWEGVWVTEPIGSRTYETLYHPAPEGIVLGVGLEALDLRWHFYTYSRYVLFYGSVLLACIVAWGVRRLLPWRGWKFSFRARLVAAFALVSLIPVVLLAWYNRQSLQQEAEISTDAFLRSETGLALTEITSRMGMSVPYELGRFGEETLVEVAADLNTEVHLYDGAFLRGSSRPDLVAAELIDRRIPAEAFRGLFLYGRNFEAVEQSMGSVRYLVGYRAIRSQSGETIGAVAVPSLSRQEIASADLARRDVILYGIYILVLAIALLTGTWMAGQIARPVGRLTAAARRVSTGDLDVDLETGRGDELGQLETAFKGMTEDLRQVQERMVAVERELAWKEMARQVAHEIKNPLTPMRLSVQHLVSSYQKGAAGFAEVLRTVSSTVLEQIDALSRIASEFSAFARLPERRIDRCDVHSVIDEAAALFHREGVRFASAYVPGSPEVKADREELRRAFINIFRNSVQAAGEAGVSIGVTTALDGNILAIAFSDDGPGMTEEVRERLFEPNFSTKTDGMGIGLTIVKKTIEDLDGTISVESAQGRGTTVRIRLPLAEAGRG